MNERRNFFSMIGRGILGVIGLAYYPLKSVAGQTPKADIISNPSPWCFGEFEDGELQNADQFMSDWHIQGGEGTPDGPLTRYLRFGRCVIRPKDTVDYLDPNTFQRLRVHGEVEFTQGKVVRENPTREHFHPIVIKILPNSVILAIPWPR